MKKEDLLRLNKIDAEINFTVQRIEFLKRDIQKLQEMLFQEKTNDFESVFNFRAIERNLSSFKGKTISSFFISPSNALKALQEELKFSREYLNHLSSSFDNF